MERFDLYTHVHKAVRVLLFDALAAVGRADFERESELPGLLAVLRRTIRLTRSHARHEDREIHPILRRLDASVAADLEAGHDRFEGLHREIEKTLARMESASAAERLSLGKRLHERLGGLVADELTHMGLEESRASRLLWAHLNDAELAAIQGRIVAAIEPDELAEWLELLLPAGNRAERAGLVAALSSAMPAEPFDRLTAGARIRLGEESWAETVAAASELAAGATARAGAAS